MWQMRRPGEAGLSASTRRPSEARLSDAMRRPDEAVFVGCDATPRRSRVFGIGAAPRRRRGVVGDAAPQRSRVVGCDDTAPRRSPVVGIDTSPLRSARLFLIITTITSLLFFRWRARLLLNYDYYHELCFVFCFGWCARLFLINTNFTTCFSGRVRGYFLFTLTIARFVFSSGGVCGYF